MSDMKNTIDLFPYTHMDMSPQAFISMDNETRGNIRSVEICPPHLGNNDFGYLRVGFKTPIYDVRKPRMR